MSYFKALVSKKKRRFQEEGFDLDLTYIKPNIVAMGFPSEKLEGVYRNHIEEVLRFLEIRHQDHYKIYNLCSERHYDPAKFNNRVATYPFDDHNAPPFELIKPFCEDVEEFLKEDENNVAFIHCKAGKGRTGVMICAYLLHINHFKESKDALKYYGNARTRNAKGVTIPSQRRYVLYYNHLLRHGLQYTRTMVLLKGFQMAPIPSFQNSTCNPFYEVWQQKVKLCQSKIDESKKSIDGFSFDLSLPIPICGDIRVEFFHKDRFKKERMFQFWFNTFFVSQAAVTKEIFEDEPTLKTFELDTDIRYFDVGKPDLDKAHKDLKHKIYASNFKIRVIYSEVGLEASSSASLPRKAKPVMVSKHQKSRSMDSFNDMNSLGQNDDFSDTDNEEEWLKEGKQVVKGRPDTDNEEEWQKEDQQVVKRRSDSDIEEEWQKEGKQVVKGRSDTDNEEEWQKEGQQVVKRQSDTDIEEEWQKEGQQVVKGRSDTDNEEEWQKEGQQVVKRRSDTDIEEEWQKKDQQVVKGRSDIDNEEEWQKEGQRVVKRRSDTDNEEEWQKGQQTYV